MQDSSEVEIRLLQESDIAAAMDLKRLAGWNQTETDWRTLLQLEPNGCFAAVLDDQLLGTTTTTSYGSQLAWIGMVLVRARKTQDRHCDEVTTNRAQLFGAQSLDR